MQHPPPTNLRSLPLKRRDWVEIEDHPGCPGWLRDAMTGYLQVVIDKARPYDVAAPILKDLLADLETTQLLDLASGGGGPWPQLRERLLTENGSLEVRLSDLAPSREAIARVAAVPGVTYEPAPVSALAVSESEARVWTMFTALHHFSPNEVAALMKQAQERGVGFAAFEATERSVRGILVTLLIPVLTLFLMPLVRPRRLLPLVLTYLPPLLPLVIWWDGFVSTLRTYTVAELEDIAGRVAVPGYEWSVSELNVAGVPIPVLAVVGRPSHVVGRWG